MQSDFNPANGGKAKELDANKFVSLFGSVLRREAWFSKEEPAPMLGAYGNWKEQVEGFYDLWYNFNS